MRKQEIVVEQHHIDAGWPMSSCECPVALAVRDATGFEPSIDLERVVFYDDDHYELLTVTSAEYQGGGDVRRFITRFDRGASVEPFSFWLPVPVATGETK